MAHTSRCAKATGPLSKCRCACGGALHAGGTGVPNTSGALPHRRPAIQTRLPIAENPRVARIRAGAATGIAHRALAGGESGSKAEFVTYNDGTRVVRKGHARWQDYDLDHHLDAEVLGPVVLECAGLPAPAVCLDDDGEHVLIERYDDDVIQANACRYSGLATLTLAGGPDGPGVDDAWAMVLADVAMSNSDRNDENWGIRDGRIAGVWDHSTCFDWSDQSPHGPPAGRLLGGFSEWVADKDGWRPDRGDEDRIELTAADVALMKRRLKAQRHRFTDPALKRDRSAWYRACMARLNALEPHCQGTRNRVH
jgi:hypothetical protein